MRAEKSVKNIAVVWVIQLLVSFGGFLMRIVFVRVLNEEYLGLSSLFANVLTVLSLAELGVGSAITYSLYKPIAENDTEQIVALMQFFKKFYIFVGCFVLIIGTMLIPALPHFVKEMPGNVDHIYFIFFMYVFNSGISYFYSYKATLINANQEYYIYSLNHGICYSIMIVLQIIILIVTKNFIAYYLVQIIATIVENLRMSSIANKRYPVLQVKKKYEIPKDIMKSLKVNTFALIGHNLGNIVLNSTDNIIISKFIGVLEVGIYSNYLLITQTINAFLLQTFSSIVSSIGNLMVEGKEEQKENTFYMIFFANFWIYAFTSIAIYVLSTPFIGFVFGNQFQFPSYIVALIAINFYSTGMRQTTLSFKSANGIFLQDVHKAYIEAILNLIISIVLVRKIGIAGVILGTIISTYAVAIWVEPKVLFKYGFHKKPTKYFAKFGLYLILFLILGEGTSKLANLIPFTGLSGFALKTIIVLVAPNFAIIVIFMKSKEFQLLISTIKNVLISHRTL